MARTGHRGPWCPVGAGQPADLRSVDRRSVPPRRSVPVPARGVRARTVATIATGLLVLGRCGSRSPSAHGGGRPRRRPRGPSPGGAQTGVSGAARCGPGTAGPSGTTYDVQVRCDVEHVRLDPDGRRAATVQPPVRRRRGSLPAAATLWWRVQAHRAPERHQRLDHRHLHPLAASQHRPSPVPPTGSSSRSPSSRPCSPGSRWPE